MYESSVILWKGLDNTSLENCYFRKSGIGYEANSVIVGLHQNSIFRTDYFLKTNHLWETTSLEITNRIGNFEMKQTLISVGNGQWTVNGDEALQLSGCLDIDISITPLTNSLPINRLQLNVNDTKQIRVVYFDAFSNLFSSMLQKYTRNSATQYHFETMPNFFEGDIEVDNEGIVVSYALLFERLYP